MHTVRKNRMKTASASSRRATGGGVSLLAGQTFLKLSLDLF
jgi:hypothetical protein